MTIPNPEHEVDLNKSTIIPELHFLRLSGSHAYLLLEMFGDELYEYREELDKNGKKLTAEEKATFDVNDDPDGVYVIPLVAVIEKMAADQHEESIKRCLTVMSVLDQQIKNNLPSYQLFLAEMFIATNELDRADKAQKTFGKWKAELHDLMPLIRVISDKMLEYHQAALKLISEQQPQLASMYPDFISDEYLVRAVDLRRNIDEQYPFLRLKKLLNLLSKFALTLIATEAKGARELSQGYFDEKLKNLSQQIEELRLATQPIETTQE